MAEESERVVEGRKSLILALATIYYITMCCLLSSAITICASQNLVY